MTNPSHEERILKFIEELNFCYDCGKELDPERDSFFECLDCDRATCARCSRCACDSADTDPVIAVSDAAQEFLDGLAGGM